MPAKLPTSVTAYFAAKNRHDIDAMLGSFGEDAVVVDERREWRGRPAIREWLEETTAKYRPTAEIAGIDATDGGAFVTALISGTFPGSPVTLRFAFMLADGLIGRLEIVQ